MISNIQGRARDALKHACAASNIDQLRSMIQTGDALGLSGEDLQAARRLLDEEELRTERKKRLQTERNYEREREVINFQNEPTKRRSARVSFKWILLLVLLVFVLFSSIARR